MTPQTPSVLTIAGSDSGGGAGIQADLKTFAAHGVHGLSAITALTAQHTRGVTAVHVPDREFLRAQIRACFEDFDVRVVKIGMLATAEVVQTVAEELTLLQPAHIVLDPVMVATSGATLLEDQALNALRTLLLPMASVVTPNIPESDWLTRYNIGSGENADHAVQVLRKLSGNAAVLLKGGHLDEGDHVIDRYCDQDGLVQFRHPRIRANAHGTGCTLASAIAANLCNGMPMRQACEAAVEYVATALHLGYRPGHSDIVVLHHVRAGTALKRIA